MNSILLKNIHIDSFTFLILSVIYDFFVAGTETSSTTLKWVVLHLVLHQVPWHPASCAGGAGPLQGGDSSSVRLQKSYSC